MKKNTGWKIGAVIFALISFGAIQETFRICTSSAPDIAPQRGQLMIISFIMTGFFITVAILFWRASKDKSKPVE